MVCPNGDKASPGGALQGEMEISCWRSGLLKQNKIALRDFSQIFLAMVMELPKLQKTCSVALKGSIPWVSPTTCTGDASALSPVAAKQQAGPSKAG